MTTLTQPRLSSLIDRLFDEADAAADARRTEWARKQGITSTQRSNRTGLGQPGKLDVRYSPRGVVTEAVTGGRYAVTGTGDAMSIESEKERLQAFLKEQIAVHEAAKVRYKEHCASSSRANSP